MVMELRKSSARQTNAKAIAIAADQAAPQFNRLIVTESDALDKKSRFPGREPEQRCVDCLKFDRSERFVSVGYLDAADLSHEFMQRFLFHTVEGKLFAVFDRQVDDLKDERLAIDQAQATDFVD